MMTDDSTKATKCDDVPDGEDARLIRLYRQRLQIPCTTTNITGTATATATTRQWQNGSDLPPTYETLALLVERHLQHIPFENLALHMTSATYGQTKNGLEEDVTPTTNNNDRKKKKKNIVLVDIPLDRELLIDKLLCRNRGGCCLELNGLFAHLLRALGYPHVWLVPCWVAAGRERGHASRQAKFRTTQSHFVLLVRVRANVDNDNKHDSKNGQPRHLQHQFLVDVGLGEPPINPLQYDLKHLNKIQTTPEGMNSRIRWDPKGIWVDGQKRKRQCLIQEWFKDEQWEPRLQWDVSEAPLSVSELPTRQYSLFDFAPVIDILKHDKSSFARKLIVCRLTRTNKISMAGRKLRITTPRFPTCDNAVTDESCNDDAVDSTINVDVTVTELSDEQVLETFWVEFGIRLQADEILHWTASDASSNSQLWDHL